MTKLYNKIKTNYEKSKLFKYLLVNQNIIRKMSILKNILFGIFTVSFVISTFLFAFPFYFIKFTNFRFLLVDDLAMGFFSIFFFSFSIFLTIHFYLKKYNQYLSFLKDED